ncbi:MAG: TIGR04076 family protein [Candidatus Aminicenantes bacterium]|nr:TIGR04076 family protein [Candidatus Aminicenantes bacterium]
MARIKVTVERINGACNLPHLVGDHFFVDGSRLVIPEGGHVCIWALQSMMPIFPILSVKDRLEAGHWTSKVKTFSCPDPHGLVQFRLEVVDPRESGPLPFSGPSSKRPRPAKARSASASGKKPGSRAPRPIPSPPGRRKKG